MTAPRGFLLRKCLGLLAMPAGLLWMGLLAGLALSASQGKCLRSLLLLVLVVAYTAAGSQYVGGIMLAALEAPYRDVRPLELGHFDAVFVMGGGARLDSRSAPQLTDFGDRSLLAARLYSSGQTPLLVSSSRAEIEIWRELGVPESAIHFVRFSDTSRSETQGFAAFAQGQEGRVGLVTSACHMRRALRLCAARGFNPEPLPADWRGFDSWSGSIR